MPRQSGPGTLRFIGVACLLVACLLVASLLCPLPAAAQTPPAGPPAQTPPSTELIRIFLDCQFECDEEYLRQNVTFIDYVRDRTVADLHVLVTTQSTGGGGMAWTVAFIGVGRFQGQDRTLTFSTPQTATSDERRREFARVFKLGLAGYAATSAVASRLDVTFSKPDAAAPTTAARDPWNFWVFRINGGGNMNGEQRQKSRSFRVSFSANRTTEQWKISLSGNRETDRSDFELEDETVVSRRHSWSVNGLVVKSLGAHWSLGFQSRTSHSSFSNTDNSFHAAPGIEFDIFPYAESSRRSLTIQYNVGATFYDYREITIYDKASETVPNHSVSASLGLRQPWGSVSAMASVSQHLNNTERYRAGVFGSTDVRLFKGFSFNVFGSYDRIRDQIGLPKAGISTEEVLLRIRQLETGYSYYVSVGVSYSFGSIFNSVVNPRFGGGGSHIIFF